MAHVILPEQCNRSAAAAVHAELIEALGSGTLDIDGTGVKQAGCAMLQVLASARRSADSVTITPSPALHDAASNSGLHTMLFDEVA